MPTSFLFHLTSLTRRSISAQKLFPILSHNKTGPHRRDTAYRGSRSLIGQYLIGG